MATSPQSRHARSMVALLEAQAQEIRALQRVIRDLDGRLAILVELDSMVADQLISPLKVIQETLEGLRDQGGSQWHEQMKDALNEIVAVSGVVSELVKPQPVMPARVERSRLVRVPLDGLVEQALSVVAPSLDRRLVEVVLPPGYMITTSPRRLVGILINLFENAAAHGGSGPIECTGDSSDGWLQIEVADRGVGVGHLDLEALFEPMPAEEQREDGSPACGLYLVRMLARSLGGEATVADRPGGGTVARVQLPQRREEDLNSPSRPHPSSRDNRG